MLLLNRVCPTLLVGFVYWYALTGGGTGRFLFVALLAWAFATFGIDFATLIGIQTNSTTSKYIDGFIRGFGWLLLSVFAAIAVLGQ